MQTMKRTFSVLALGFAIIATPAFAQQPAPARVRGTIEKVEGSVLTVRSGEADVKVTVADNVQVFGVTKATLADVKVNSFVGVGAMPQTDGRQRALQVMIFAEQQRGLGEGHRPWTQPGSTMTNGTVDT